jgi:DNA-binding NarL/FixJ family response regulator
MFSEDRYVFEALRAGARGYVLKDQIAADLINAIQHVTRGMLYLSPRVSDAVVNALIHPESADALTEREDQVLQLIAEGRTTKEIAATLEMSVKTATTHRQRIMRKLDIHSTAELVRYAAQRGLIGA